jgi:hypothetical protein
VQQAHVVEMVAQDGPPDFEVALVDELDEAHAGG